MGWNELQTGCIPFVRRIDHDRNWMFTGHLRNQNQDWRDRTGVKGLHVPQFDSPTYS